MVLMIVMMMFTYADYNGAYVKHIDSALIYTCIFIHIYTYVKST
jgi:hypothetical protein